MLPNALLQSAPAGQTANRPPIRHYTAKALALAALFQGGLAAPEPAHAADGCLVLLCFAAPNWRSIPQCVGPIRSVLRDLARGRSFPRCAMSGGGNVAGNQWARAPGNCPPQYTRAYGFDNEVGYECDFAGAVSVMVNGSLYSRTWWRFDGDSVTEYSAAAKAQLGQWDTRFDDDYAKWLASLPPQPPIEPASEY